jgi:threonine dehydratase
MTFTPMKQDVILKAHQRISPFIHRTPLMHSSLLNDWLGHEIVFKVEGLQKIGAFKIRGALNALLHLKEQNQLPKEVVAFSSGNHAQAVALAAKQLGVKATIILPSFTSKIKQQATRGYGATVINTNTRPEAEKLTAEIEAKDAYFIHPYDNDDVIAGQGTACLEALQEYEPNAVFAPCGGGGLLSGTYLAAQTMQNPPMVFAGEPLGANDASISYNTGKIHKLDNTPDTIADGARTLAISERTFHYLQKLNGFYEISEQEMLYWTQWVMHLLKISCEPTSALAIAAAAKWLKEQTSKKKVLVILSGGNVAPETYLGIWKNNYLEKLPCQEF